MFAERYKRYTDMLKAREEEQMTTAMDVADYIESTHSTTGAMQLQKLLYYSQAWSLAWTGRPLFSDEIEAWTKGPVVRQVWSQGTFRAAQTALSEAQRRIVDAVVEFYGRMGGGTLSSLTHRELPWAEAREGLSANESSTRSISQATMRRFYTRKSVERGKRVPVRPQLTEVADDAAVAVTVALQRNRWRATLNDLATR